MQLNHLTDGLSLLRSDRPIIR